MLPAFLLLDKTPVLVADGLKLRSAKRSDYQAWRELRLKSREFLKPFEPRWSEIDLSPRVFNGRLRRNKVQSNAGTEYSFLIFDTSGRSEKLVGGLTISNVHRRAAQNANLGYWMGADYAGKGLMTKAVSLALIFAFNTLQLHRVQAACLPHNKASRRVLEKNGFREEGFAENYLQIDGKWQDHVLYALTRERLTGTRSDA